MRTPLQATQLFGAGEVKCDYERHSNPRAGGCWQPDRRSRKRPQPLADRAQPEAVTQKCNGGAPGKSKPKGLDSKSAADIAASLTNALTELRGWNGASIDISD